VDSQNCGVILDFGIYASTHVKQNMIFLKRGYPLLAVELTPPHSKFKHFYMPPPSQVERN
jgi:hypothetical protein